MATVTNVLTTVLEIAGVGMVTQGIAGVARETLQMAAAQDVAKTASAELTGVQNVLLLPLAEVVAQTKLAAGAFVEAAAVALGASEAETVMAATTAALEAALAVLLSPLVLVTAALGLLVAGIGLAVKSAKAFREIQDAGFKLQTVLANVGRAGDFDKLQASAFKTADAAGMARSEFLSLDLVLTKYGLTTAETARVSGALADASAGTGRSLESVGQALGHALIPGGRTLGFSQIVGHEFRKTGDRAKDLAQAVQLLNDKFRGLAGARRETLTGALDSLHNAFQNLFASIGQIFNNPAFIKAINTLADAINLIAKGISYVGAHSAQNEAANAGEEFARRMHPGIVGKGVKGDPEQTALLAGIEQNTGKFEDIVKKVFGESGAQARGAFSLRDSMMAMRA